MRLKAHLKIDNLKLAQHLFKNRDQTLIIYIVTSFVEPNHCLSTRNL